MQKLKHTTGPWRWEWNFPCSNRIALLGPDQKIENAVLDFDDGILRVNGERRYMKEVPPDLRLIAATPKLLAALEAVLAAQSMEGHPRFGHTRSQSGTRAWEDATRRANALAIAVIAEVNS